MEADDASGYPSQPFDDENIEDVEADLTPTVSPPRGADMLTALATIKGIDWSFLCFENSRFWRLFSFLTDATIQNYNIH